DPCLSAVPARRAGAGRRWVRAPKVPPIGRGPRRYTERVDERRELRVVWDRYNRFHLLVERAYRGISIEDVERVVTDPDTRVQPLPTGGHLRIGRAPNGRFLAVVTIGVSELYPKTAWWASEGAWRRARE